MLILLFHQRRAQGLPLTSFPYEATEAEYVVHSSDFLGVAGLGLCSLFSSF